MSDSIFTLIGRQTRGMVGDKLDISGGTLTGLLTLSGDPTTPLHAATKGYVDNTVLNLSSYARLDGANFTGDVSGTNLTLSGNLTVNGQVTALETTNSTIADSLILLSKGAGAGSNAQHDSGILIERGSAESNVAMYWDEGDDRFRFISTSLGADSTDLSTNATEADIAVKGISTNGNDLGTIEEFYGGILVADRDVLIPKGEFDSAASGGSVAITGEQSPFPSVAINVSYGNPFEVIFELIEQSDDGVNTTASVQTISLSEGALDELKSTGTLTIGSTVISFT